MTPQHIEDKIKGYRFAQNRIEEYTEKLEAMTIHITSSTENAYAPTNGFHSKVEDYGVKSADLKMMIEEYKRETDKITNLINCTGLDQTEKEVLWCLARGERLLAYAERNHMPKYRVYKTKEKAIKKIWEKTEKNKRVL